MTDPGQGCHGLCRFPILALCIDHDFARCAVERGLERGVERIGKRPAAEPETRESRARTAVDLSPRALANAPLIQAMRNGARAGAQGGSTSSLAGDAAWTEERELPEGRVEPARSAGLEPGDDARARPPPLRFTAQAHFAGPAAARFAAVQRVGKTGHILIGAAVGTIVPILGTIIGGIVGYRVWKNKQKAANAAPANVTGVGHGGHLEEVLSEMSPSRLHEVEIGVEKMQQRVVQSGERKRLNEPEPLPNDRPDLVRAWIEEVKTLISDDNLNEAWNRLRSDENEGRFNIKLSIQYGRGVDPVRYAERNKYEPDNRAVRLFMKAGGEFKNPHELKMVLLMHLEEYMHHYQYISNHFMSEATGAFKRDAAGLPDMAETQVVADADYDEIDIAAQLMDWGFDIDALGFTKRYEEREAFAAWRRTRV